MEIDNKKDLKRPSPISEGNRGSSAWEEMAYAAGHIYQDIMKVELGSDKVCVLYSRDYPQHAGMEYYWREYLEWYLSERMALEPRVLLEEFSSPGMLKRCLDGESIYTRESFCRMEEKDEEMTMQAFLCRDLESGHRAYVLVRRSGEEQMPKTYEKVRGKMIPQTRLQTHPDPFTGLLDYPSTVARIEESLLEEAGFALLSLKIDDLEEIRHRLGQEAEGELMRQAACVLKKSIREYDLVGRTEDGGFVVFLRDLYSMEEAENCAARLCGSIQGIRLASEQELSLHCSIGIALAPDEGRDYGTLMKKAEEMLQRTKREK